MKWEFDPKLLQSKDIRMLFLLGYFNLLTRNLTFSPVSFITLLDNYMWEDGNKIEVLLICTKIMLMDVNMELEFRFFMNQVVKWKEIPMKTINKKHKIIKIQFFLIFTMASLKITKGKAMEFISRQNHLNQGYLSK